MAVKKIIELHKEMEQRKTIKTLINIKLRIKINMNIQVVSMTKVNKMFEQI